MTVAGDVAGAAAEKTVDIWQAGKDETYQPFPLEAVVTATQSAAAELSLKEIKEEKHPDQLKLIYTDDRKQKFVVTIVRRSATLTELHVDVGLFGVGGLSPTLLRQIVWYLPKNPQTPHPTTMP